VGIGVPFQTKEAKVGPGYDVPHIPTKTNGRSGAPLDKKFTSSKKTKNEIYFYYHKKYLSYDWPVATHGYCAS
jgi:hypothetical protein